MVVQDAVEFRVAGLPQVGAVWNALADGKTNKQTNQSGVMSNLMSGTETHTMYRSHKSIHFNSVLDTHTKEEEEEKKRQKFYIVHM